MRFLSFRFFLFLFLLPFNSISKDAIVFSQTFSNLLVKLAQTEEEKKKGLNSYEIKVFRQLREKYDLSLESIESTKEEETELSDEAKVTLERIKKGEVFTL